MPSTLSLSTYQWSLSTFTIYVDFENDLSKWICTQIHFQGKVYSVLFLKQTLSWFFSLKIKKQNVGSSQYPGVYRFLFKWQKDNADKKIQIKKLATLLWKQLISLAVGFLAFTGECPCSFAFIMFPCISLLGLSASH